MTTRPRQIHKHQVHTQLGRAAVQIFAANDRMNQVLIEHLDPTAWRAKPPGKARTIAAIFTHMSQCPLQVGQAYSSAPEGSSTAQPRALHAAAGPCGIGRECGSLRGDARRRAGRWRGPRREVSQRRLGSALAGWSGNAVLHACSRSPPSRAGVYAGASTRIPVAERGGVRDLELGKAVERVRVVRRPRL